MSEKKQVFDLHHIAKKSREEICAKFGIGKTAFYAIVDQDAPTAEAIQQEAEKKQEQLKLLPEDFEVEEALSNTFAKSVRLLESLVDEAIEGETLVDEEGRRVPIKTLMDCLDKARTYQATLLKSRATNTSGVDKEAMMELWKSSATLFLKCRKEGIDYDEKAHLQHVLDDIAGKSEDLND